MTNPQTEPLIVVVSGPFASGKTEFVTSIGEEIAETDAFPNTPIAPYYGRKISHDNTALFLLTPPGARRFDFMWEAMASGRMIGFVVMVDSRKPETFRDARGILETMRVYSGLPGVVAANFQDHPTAWDADLLHVLMRLPDMIPILPCVATDRESVKSVLLALLDQVIAAIDMGDEVNENN